MSTLKKSELLSIFRTVWIETAFVSTGTAKQNDTLIAKSA
jgi:hypothetical protein